jgi:hypothetical protein
MVKLKISFEPRANAHKSVHCFAGVSNFRSEKAGYEIVSKEKSPRGHTPGRGTFFYVRPIPGLKPCPRGHTPGRGTF